MYSLLRFLSPPRSPSTNPTEPDAPRCGRNWYPARPRTGSYGDLEGVQSPSLRRVHSYEPYPSPYPSPGFASRTSTGLGHRGSSSRRSKRPYPALQLGQGGWHLMPPSASSHHGTILGPTDLHQPGSITTTSFTPDVGTEQNPGDLSIAGGNREGWGCHPAWDAGGGELAPFPVLTELSACGDGSSSIQQADFQPSMTQGQIETPLHPGFSSTIPHPTVNPTTTPPTVGNTIQETEEVFRGHTSAHPSVTSDWRQPFNEWLPTRRHQMKSIQGLGDPVLCRIIWVRVFGGWLQLRQLSQGFGDFDTLPRCWNDVFDFWLQQLLKPDPQGLDAPCASSTQAPLSTGSSIFSTSPPATANTPDVSSPYCTSSSRKARKRIPNAVSTLTVQEIQEACRRNEADESVIARLAIVFPDIVAREHLKLAGQPGSSARDQRGHHGYMEFAERCMVSPKNVKKRTRGTGAGQVQRYHCKLCGPVKRPRWKNSKDLLDHVWDTHCDPQGDVE